VWPGATRCSTIYYSDAGIAYANGDDSDGDDYVEEGDGYYQDASDHDVAEADELESELSGSG